MGNERNSIFVLITFDILLIILLYFISPYYFTMVPSLDWYVPEISTTVKIMNVTYYHIIEGAILIGCYFVHQHYPKEFNIKQEILATFILNLMFDNSLELIITILERPYCIFGMWHFNALVDILRTFGFMTVLWYLSTKSKNYFPHPFLWILDDLSKFIFLRRFVPYFHRFLTEKEPDSNRCLT